MAKFKDLTGLRFGNLTVCGQAERTSKGRIMWQCLCDCGKYHKVATCHLKSGAVIDCGCGKSKKTAERNLKHGDSKTRLYNIWIKMKDRCKNPSNKDWNLYGGKGITVCEEWESSYITFKEWALKNGYSDNKSIDRINGNKGYFPENCRWATAKEQANNISRNHVIEYHGNQMTIAEAANTSSVSYGTLKQRIRKGWNIEKAIETPTEKHKKEE